MPALWQSRCKNVQMYVFAKFLILKAKLAAFRPKEGRCRFWQLKINKLAWVPQSKSIHGRVCTGIYICHVMYVYSDQSNRRGVHLYFFIWTGVHLCFCLCLRRNVKRKCSSGRFFIQQNKFLCPSFTLNNSSGHPSSRVHNFSELFYRHRYL